MNTEIYTDGSFLSRNSTSGYGVFSPHDIRLCACGTGREISNSGLAEYLAIRIALALALTYQQDNGRVTIYTDYQAAVDAFNKGALVRFNGSANMLDEIATLLLQCRDQGIEISFIKVKGHDGVVGNVIADRLAYLGRVYRLETVSTEFQYCVSVLASHFGATVSGISTEIEPNNSLSMLLANIILRPRESIRVNDSGQLTTTPRHGSVNFRARWHSFVEFLRLIWGRLNSLFLAIRNSLRGYRRYLMRV